MAALGLLLSAEDGMISVQVFFFFYSLFFPFNRIFTSSFSRLKPQTNMCSIRIYNMCILDVCQQSHLYRCCCAFFAATLSATPSAPLLGPILCRPAMTSVTYKKICLYMFSYVYRWISKPLGIYIYIWSISRDCEVRIYGTSTMYLYFFGSWLFCVIQKYLR